MLKAICVGLGVRGRAWTRWAAEAGLEVAGVVDLDDAVRQKAGDELGIDPAQRFADIGEAAAATGADVATVCTANEHHLGAIRTCLEAGLHVLVEKPMVQRHGDALAVLDLARRAGRRVAVAQNYRFTPAVGAVRTAVQDGLVGQVLTIDIAFSRWRPAPGMVLPLLLNQSIHHFDAVRSVLGADPTWCFARSWNPTWSPSDGPTLLQAMWGLDAAHTAAANDEVVFTYSGNYITHGFPTPYSGCWRIEGSKGRIEFAGDSSDAPAPVLQRRETEEAIALPMPEVPSAEVAVCRAFREALERGAAGPTDATDNIRSLSMCWAAEMASAERRVVAMDDFL